MMLAMMTSACLAAAVMAGQPVEERPAQILVEFRLVEIDLSETAAAPQRTEPQARTVIEFTSNGSLSVKGDGLPFASMHSRIFTVGDEAAISVRGWHFAVDGLSQALENSPFTVVSSPRILTPDGMPARITVGQLVDYLEPAEEAGTFRVVKTEEREGLSFGITARLRADGTVLLDPVEFDLREVTSREPIEGLNLQNVGKPLMHTTSQSASVIVAPDETVLIPIMHSNFQNQPLVLLVKARNWPVGKPVLPDGVPGDADEASGTSAVAPPNENTPEESGASKEEPDSPE